MGKLIKLMTAAKVTLLLCSCVGQEPDNIAYVTALGIDKAKTGYVYTIQFAQPVKISGGASEEGGSGGDIVENIVVNSPTLYSAINNADSIVSKDLSLSHAKVIVISKDTAKEGLNGINDLFARNNDIRPDIYFAIAENAGKYLEEVKPAIELNPVKYYQLTYENKNGSAIPQNTAMDFYSACLSKTEDCLLPLAGVAKTKEREGKEDKEKAEDNQRQNDAVENKGGFEDGSKNYFAGQAGSKVKNKSESVGAAVFKNSKYVGDIGSTETELYNIMNNQFRSINISLYSKANPDKPIAVQLEKKIAPTYHINKEEKRVNIDLKLEGELLSASSEYEESESEDKINEYASRMMSDAANEFIRKMYKDYKADIFGIRGRLRAYFISMKAYDKYCESFNPEDWEITVRTVMRLKRNGMTHYY